MSAPINPAHAYAVYQYTEKAKDPYYIGKRFISANQRPGEPLPDNLVIVATAETIEECQQNLPPLTRASVTAWWLQQLKQTGLTEEEWERAMVKEDAA